MKTILISQKIFKDKHKQLQFSLEKEWIDYFKNKNVQIIPIFSKTENINIYFKKFKPNYVIISGGSNNIFKNSSEDILRRKIDKKIFDICKKKKIPLLAVCYGFQYIAKLFKGKIVKAKQKPGKDHNIYLNNKIINVNSFHTLASTTLPKHFKIIGIHKDNSIEIAHSKKFNILCMMFHPERKNRSQSIVNNIVFDYLKL